MKTASAASAAVNPNGIKTFLVHGLITFYFNCNPVFSNGIKSLPKNLPDCPILFNWVFDNFIWADESFAKALQGFESCVSVNKNLCRKLFSSFNSPATFNEILLQYYILFQNLI